MIRSRLITTLIALIVLVFAITAQPDTSKPEAPEIDPYVTGEALTYVGKYKRFGLFSFTIAELNFRVIEAGGDNEYYVLSEGKSRGSLAKLFNFKFYLKIDSYVNPDKLQVEKTKKRDEQGVRIRDSEADFDYDVKRVTYVETDPNEPTKAPRRVASEIEPDTQDIVTAVYKLRGKDLAVGKRFVFKVSDSGLVYHVPVNVTGRERIKSKLGKRWCWRIEPEIFGTGRIIEQKGKLTIWITDDEDRVPVSAKLKTELGNVNIKLSRFSNLRSAELTGSNK